MKKTVVGRLRGVCGTAALASTETKSPGSAGRDLPHNPRRGNGLETRPTALRLSRRTDSGHTWCAHSRPRLLPQDPVRES